MFHLHTIGWFPTLRYDQAGLYHVEGMHYGHNKASNHPAKVSDQADQACCIREDQLEVHRYLIQVRTRSLPDRGREEELHGLDEEGQDLGRESCTKSVNVFDDQNHLDLFDFLNEL